MPLQLEIISEHTDLVGDDYLRKFGDDGGTIGRGLDNDWILPDPDKYISGQHAVIDHKGGIWYLMDLSTNGVYVNDESEPIGSGNPRRLFDGDMLRMGDFEIRVTIDKGESIAMPLEPEPDDFPSNIEQLVPEVTLRTGVQLLDEEEITGDEDFQSALFGSGPKESVSVVEELEALDELEALNDESAHRPAIQPTRVSVTSDDLFDTFLDGLGISRADLHPSIEPAQVMQNAGEVMREFVDGMNKLLVSRANLKTAFRLDQTTVLPRHNNPLKLSENVTDSIKQLLIGQEGEYLGPRDAMREVCRDLLHHQDAFLDAMTNAFVEFADRFDPDELVQSFQHNVKSAPLLGFLDKLKFWELYCDLYPVMTEKGGGRFPQMFAEEFVKSYERQIAEYKRLDPAEALHRTVVLEPMKEVEDDFDPQSTDVFDETRDQAEG